MTAKELALCFVKVNVWQKWLLKYKEIITQEPVLKKSELSIASEYIWKSHIMNNYGK